VYGEYRGDYDEEDSKGHCVEGELEIQQTSMGKLTERVVVKVTFARAHGRS